MTGRPATRRQPLRPLAERPLASVVIPLFDMEDYVGDALASVRGSGYENWECIVVDDGSTDRSAEVVAAVARADDRVRLLSKDNGGPLSCLGMGLMAARGDVVLLLDADDLVTPDRIEAVIAAFRSRPEAGFAVHRLVLTDGGQRAIGLSPGARHLPDGDLSAVVLAHGSGVPHLGVSSAFAFRAEVLRALLPAPTLPRRFPDEYLRRVAPLVTDVVAIERVLGVRRLHPGSLTARHSDRLERDLAAACDDYRLLDQAFDCVAHHWAPGAPTGNATDVLGLEWSTARLGGDPAWRDRWQALRTAPGFAALPARERRYWQFGRYLPRPAFRYLVQARAQSAGPRLVVSYLRMMTDRQLRPPAHQRASLRQVARLALSRR